MLRFTYTTANYERLKQFQKILYSCKTEAQIRSMYAWSDSIYLEPGRSREKVIIRLEMKSLSLEYLEYLKNRACVL